MDKCPMNSSEFEAAAKRRNCTKETRYLCAPDKYLSNLIEFCSDTSKSLFGEGNVMFFYLYYDDNDDDIRKNTNFKNTCQIEIYYLCKYL